MSNHTNRCRFIPDFTEDDLLQTLEMITNGIWIQRSGMQMCRMTRLTASDTGANGELVTVKPYAIAFRTASFIPAGSASKIVDERNEERMADEDPYCFALDADADTLELMTHNALVKLSARMTAGYAVPLFYRRKILSALRKNCSETLLKGSHPEKAGNIIAENPLTSSFALITPGEAIEKTESQLYISYTAQGGCMLHLGDTRKKFTQKPFLLSDHLSEIVNAKDNEPLDSFAHDIIDMLPELFGQSWSSRKIRHIIESALMEHIDENEIPASSSLQKAIEHLSAVEKIILAEKVLRGHLGIVLYFKLLYKS